MKIFYKLSNNIIKVYLLIFCISVFFTFDANYSADSLRYSFAGKQFLEIFFPNILDPNVGEKLLNSAEFHKNIDYSFPRREFFTIIPNIIFYFISILFEDSLNYIVILNLIFYSLLFYYCSKFYNFQSSFKFIFFLSFLFFGHYQIAGWNIKVLPEVIYFCTLISYLILLVNYKKNNLKIIFILIFLSLACFLIRPQGVIFILTLILFLLANNIFHKGIYKIILSLFVFNIFFIPIILFVDVNGIFNVPIISRENTGLLDGAIISGWINYFDGKLVYQEVRFGDKKYDFTQNYGYLDLLKIVFYRLFYYLSPYKYYQSIYINIWNIIYFLTIFVVSIKYLYELDDNLKKNLSIFLIISVLSFHLIFPVTGTFRYQLSLIAIIFVLNFEYLSLKLKKNE